MKSHKFVAVPVLAALSIVLPAVSAATLESDDFNTCTLADRWTVVDPIGDGTASVTGTGTADAHIELTVPAGFARDAWAAGGNSTLRAMQTGLSVPGDFVVEVLFVSEPSVGFNDQGLLVEQDADNFIRFDVFHNGSELRVFGGQTVGGVNTIEVNQGIGAGDARYMQIARSGDDWTLSLSNDGDAWFETGSFNAPLTVNAAGIYVANPVTAVGCTAVADYFVVDSAPISSEDSATDTCSCVDVDQDGYGEGDTCLGADCDDDDPSVHPGAEEACDGVDNDCDGTVDNDFDADQDGQSACAGDCDDGNPDVFTGAEETCDGVDNDCDGIEGDGVSSLSVTVYRQFIGGDLRGRTPLVGLPVALYDRSRGSCARTECQAGGNDYGCIFETCAPVASDDGAPAIAVTDESGALAFDLPPGHYLVIAGDGTDRHLAATIGALECGEHLERQLISFSHARRDGVTPGLEQP